MTSQIWRFGAFELDSSQGELLKDGRRVRLKPQPLAVLTALLEKRGGIVTRHELKQTLWHGEPAYQTDENLNHAVKRLREALGDSGQNPRFVATIRNNGYRFLADASMRRDLVPPEPVLGEETAAIRPPTHRAWVLTACGAAIVAMLLLASSETERTEDEAGEAPVRAVIPLEAELTFSNAPTVAISPDGRTIAYAAGPKSEAHLYVHELASERARIVPGSKGARLPFFSPDGARVGFYSRSRRRLLQVATSGGAPTSLRGTEVRAAPHGATWMPSGDIVLALTVTSGLSRLAPDGRLETITIPDRTKREKTHRLPDALPGGRGVLFTLGTVDITSFDEASIAVVDLATHETKILIEGGTCARYSPSGHIVYWREGSLYAAPFDLDRLRITAPPSLVQTHVAADPYAPAQFAIARNGTLLFAPGPPRFRARHLAWIDRHGEAQPVEMDAVFPSGDITNISLSRRGDKLAFVVGGATDHIWVHDLDRHTTSRFTLEWDNIFPTWAPDGERIAFWSNRGGGNGIFIKELDSSKEPDLLVASPARVWPTSWSSDGNRMLFMQHDRRSSDIAVAELRGEGSVETRMWLSTPFNEGWGLFSPDDRWVVLESDESGKFEIYLRAYADPETKVQVSNGGGLRPRWGPDGGEIFYWEGDRFMAVDFSDVDGRLTLGTPKPQFDNDVRIKLFDVAPDGQRFVMPATSAPPTAPTELRLVLNWGKSLK